MRRFLAFLLLLSLISCKETSTGESGSGPTGVFDVIADSSYYGLSVVHNSHLPEEIKSYDNTPGIILDLEFTLSDISRRDEINKIIIFDNDGLGWDFGREELENFYSNSLGGYIFENLLIDYGIYETDKLFFIRLINDANQKSEDYQFILKGELPYSVIDRNYWFQDNELKFEYTVQPHHNFYIIGADYQRRGYNPILASTSATVSWLDENQNLIENTGNIINSFTETEFELVYENSFSDVSASAAYSYNSFKLNKISSEYELLTQINPVSPKIPDDTEFYTMDDDLFKLLYLNEDRSVFLEPNINDQNYSYLTIYNRQTQEQIDKIRLTYDFYNDYQPVFVNEKTELIYYISDFGTLYSYELANNQTQKLTNSFDNNNTYYLFPFGNNIIVVGDYTMYLYDVSQDQIGASTNLNNRVNSYYYSDDLDALFLSYKGERFYKVTYDSAGGVFNEIEQLFTTLQSGYSPDHQNIHFSARDSVLIHTSGTVIDIRQGTEFNSDNALLVNPFLSSPISAWLEEDQVLVLRENYNNVLSAYKYNNAEFNKIGELEIRGTPVDLYSYNSKLMIGFVYPRYGFNEQHIGVGGYTLDDFIEPVEKRAFQEKYHKMKQVQL